MGVGYYCAAAAYIRTTQGWLYLRVVIDLASRKVIGWSLSQTMIAGDTIVPAWKMAVKNHPITDELIFHSDRGVQYACHEFRKLIKGYSLVRQSMSRKGNCWDNAVAESFFKTLKAELIYMVEPTTVAETKVDVFEFIEIWYNGTGRPAKKNARLAGVSNPHGVRGKTETELSPKCGLTFCPLFYCKFILLMGCEEDRIDKDLSEATTDVGSTEILKSHFYRERVIDGYQETLCSGVGGFSMYMVEVWQYEDTVTLERRSVHDTINLYYICRHEDLLDQQYFIGGAARPGIDTSDPADTICLPNAMRLVAYKDKNQNKSFDEEEALNQLSFCHGIFPRDAIVIFREELSHDCCPAEGWRITLGQDDNGDNILQDSEIDETMVRCNELKP